MKRPAYVISAVDKFADMDKVKRYAELTGPSIEQYGGCFVISNSEPKVVEGDLSSNHISMVKFPSMEAAKTWYDSPEYAEARDITPQAFAGRVLMFITGLPNGNTLCPSWTRTELTDIKNAS